MSDFYDESIEQEQKCCEWCSNKKVIGGCNHCQILGKVVEDDYVCLAYSSLIKETAQTILQNYQVEENNSNSQPKQKEGCYIATAIYGSYEAPEVLVLRRFRDEILYKSKLGKLFIKAYYKLSPPIADRLKNAKHINLWVRNRLDTFIGWLNKNKFN